MRYGYFDDDNREYVITTPDTPLPWINYLGCENFYGMISNTGGGYAFYRDAKLRRLLRYRYNGVPRDMGGRFYYIKESGCEAWSPAWLPAGTELDSYECRHGMGYTSFTSEKDELRAEFIMFIPPDEDCEIHYLTITNLSDRERNIKIYGCMEWCLYVAIDDAQNYQRNLNIAESEVTDNVIYHITEYRERRNHYAYYGVNTETSGFDTDRDTFLGRNGSWARPAAVYEETSFSSHITGGYPVAAHRVDLKLGPAESFEAGFILGYGENPSEAKYLTDGTIRKDTAVRVMRKYVNGAAIEKALDDLKKYWDDKLSAFSLSSGNDRFDRMVNIWNQYQCMITFNMSRSASAYETGTGRGMGFRDSCQDTLGFVHMIPDRTRERIIDIASTQFRNGSAYHQYQPLTKKGNHDIGSGFNDDPLWLVAAATSYIRETGDTGILWHPTPFDNEEGSEKPLIDHLRVCVNYTCTNLGPHGLPLIGRADWNDCLNLNCFSEEPGESFQTAGSAEGAVAESVFIAGLFVKYAREFADLLSYIGYTEEAKDIREKTDRMEENVLEYGWDGEWFLRAYDAYGNPVGSHVCDEGQIYIEPQGMCVMAGIGRDNGFAEKAIDSVWKNLVGEYGAEILTPCYTKYHTELGEITSYPPGFKENGSVFCHCNPWVICAETVLGRGDKAFDLYKKTAPSFIEDRSEIREAEPYCYAQTVTGRASGYPGHARNSWLTGTASWAFVSASQWILGIRPDYDGLIIAPCLPDELPEVTVTRKFRECQYRIHIKKTGTWSMEVDGCKIGGNKIPLTDRAYAEVEVTI